MHRACADLRFAEGLRRRSAEARAEASIREACSLALLEGARVEPADLRNLVSLGIPDWERIPANVAVGLAAWKATWGVVSKLPELNQRRGDARSAPPDPPIRGTLAGIHRDYGSVLATRGLCASADVGIPRSPQSLAQIFAALEQDSGSATRRAALAWGLVVLREPFAIANQVAGALVAKSILATEGVEPTAVSVLSLFASDEPAKYRFALARAGSGDWEPWFDFVHKSVVRGCQVGLFLTKEVQAGQLSTKQD